MHSVDPFLLTFSSFLLQNVNQSSFLFPNITIMCWYLSMYSLLVSFIDHHGNKKNNDSPSIFSLRCLQTASTILLLCNYFISLSILVYFPFTIVHFHYQLSIRFANQHGLIPAQITFIVYRCMPCTPKHFKN